MMVFHGNQFSYVTLFQVVRSALAALSEDTSLECVKAQQACQTTPTCGLQYHNALIKCGYVNLQSANQFSGSNAKHQCAEECRMALADLERGTAEGSAYANCRCEQSGYSDFDHFCIRHNEFFHCLTSQPPLREDHILSDLQSCNSARRYCENDKVCLDALHYYEMTCEQHYRSSNATLCPSQSCRESFLILMRQTFARYLRDCECDPGVPVPANVYCFQQNERAFCTASQDLPSLGTRIFPQTFSLKMALPSIVLTSIIMRNT